MDNVKHLIVGGGVSGLAFANFINSNDYLILEKENELGGYCRTIYQDGFIWDFAGHFFHFATKKLQAFFENKISEHELVKKNKNTKIVFKNRYIDFPFQSNIHQLDKEDFINCLYDLYFREDKSSYISFLDMLYSKFGKSITDYFLRPYNEKLYAVDLNKLDVDAMGRFFPYADLDSIIRSFKSQSVTSYNANFLYPKNGAKVFVDALAEDIPREKITLNEKLISIDSKNKIATTSNRKIKFEYLINSMPLPNLLTCLNETQLNSYVTDLTYNKVLVFNLGFDKKSPLVDEHWLYFPHKEVNFYRIGFYDNILNSDRLSLYVEIGYNSHEQINTEEQLSKTIHSLQKLGIISNHNLISHSSIIMDPAYVHVSEKSNFSKRAIFKYLQKRGIYSIGRYGNWKYCSIEDSMMDAINLAERLA